MKILKFGGTSVGTPQALRSIIDNIRKAQMHDRIAVVISAFSGVTDQLLHLSALAANNDSTYGEIFRELEKRHLEAVKQLINVKVQSRVLAEVKVRLNELAEILHGVSLVRECSLKTRDFILSFGERLSAFILAEALKDRGIAAEFLDSRELVKSDDQFGKARVLFDETYKKIQHYFAEHEVLQIITGFIASTERDETTTLGRGGSDYTAALFGAALAVSEIEIWTDVDGIMTADPKKVKKAFSLPSLTYEEVMELSHFGAKVIYPMTMQPVMDKQIPVRIKNTFNPDFNGTIISGKPSENLFVVSGISSISHIAILRLEGSGMVGVAGISERLFGALAKKEINVILITQASSEHSICFAVDLKDARKAKKAIEEAFSLELLAHCIEPVTLEEDRSILAVVGENMRHTPGVSGKLFHALGRNGINVIAIAQGSSELNIAVVITCEDEVKALNVIHEAFFLSDTKTIHLFLVGTGLVGSTLLKQIVHQTQNLLKQYSLNIRMIGFANSKRMIFQEDGIPLEKWQDLLTTSQEQTNLQEFVRRIKKLNLQNSVFVDCTASDEVVNHYEELLQAHITIVTPNKRANASSLKKYLALSGIARKAGVPFLYETTVGAGLPVINTLNDLLKSGDTILKIEGVLSGTLSYLFNTFMTSEKPMSEIVKEARAKGFTEPDPRDDLSGTDVARKLLILAREIGLLFEFKDITIENLVPVYAQEALSIDEFLRVFQKADIEFVERKKKALREGKVLRYIARIENGKAEISLQAVSHDHPFYFLSGSDNIISFTTERYRERPLVVKGPGAGAEVTAAGVFADIIRTAYL